MNRYSLQDKKYLADNYVPYLKSYYDRSDMVNTTRHFNHSHISAEIMYSYEGIFSIEVEGETVVLNPKQFIWIDAGVQHKSLYFETPKVAMMNIEYTYAKDSSLPSIAQMYSMYEPLQYMYNTPQKYRVFDDNNGSMYHLLKQITQMGIANQHYQYMSNILVEQIILLLANFWKKPSGTINSTSFITMVNAYIKANYFQNIKSQDIAEHTGLNISQLQGLYKKGTGKTISKALREYRLEKAKEILKNEDISILQLANRVGISSAQHLQKLFLERYKLKIQDYKKKLL